jgi:acyl transferase domain-containing protein/NADPH:quinone reductase-like Zn-dependent oxidoreductase
VNSFGYGGTNAHAIVDEVEGYLREAHVSPTVTLSKLESALLGRPNIWNGTLTHDNEDNQLDGQVDSLDQGVKTKILPVSRIETESFSEKIFVLSTFDQKAGERQASDLRAYLEGLAPHDEGYCSALMHDLTYTLTVRTSRLPWKMAVRARSSRDLISALETSKHVYSTQQPSLAFVFTGQGAQWYAMGRELITNPTFRDSLEASQSCLSLLGAEWEIVVELSRDESASLVNEASMSQPLCTIVQLALVDLLNSWNVKPMAVVGHSSGEIAAAYAAGLIDHESAIAAAYYRGRATIDLKTLSPSLHGAMAAVSCTEEEARMLLSEIRVGEADIACYNSASSFTISGDASAIDELLCLCESRNISCRKLKVDVAYHSKHMHVVAERYQQSMEERMHPKPRKESHCQMYSSVTGKKLDADPNSSSYWVANLVSPVRFSEALSALCSGAQKSKRVKKNARIDILLEIGPHSALAGPIRQILREELNISKASYLSVLHRGKSAMQTSLDLAMQLFEMGSHIDISSVNGQSGRHGKVLCNLPSYPWNHEIAYWAEPPVSMQYRLRKFPRHDLLGAEVRFANSLEPRWRNWIRASELPWIRDHKVQSLMVYPASGYISMAIEAMAQLAASKNHDVASYHLRDISFGQALVIPDSSEEVETMLSIRTYSEASMKVSHRWNEFTVCSSLSDGSWKEHCRGLISVVPSRETNEVNGVRSSNEERLSFLSQRSNASRVCNTPIDCLALYKKASKLGMEYGPTFSNLIQVSRGEGQSLGSVRIPDINATMPAQYHSPHVLHPATLDACLHASFAAQDDLQSAFVPSFISEIFISQGITNAANDILEVFCTIDKAAGRHTDMSITAYDMQTEHWAPAIKLSGLRVTALGEDRSMSDTESMGKKFFKTEWRPDPEFLTSSFFESSCVHLQPAPGEGTILRMLDELAFYGSEAAISQIPESSVSGLPLNFQKLYESMKDLRDNAYANGLGHDASAWLAKSESEKKMVWEAVRVSGDEGNFVHIVVSNLSKMILGEVDPLSVTLQDDALGKYYSNNPRMARQYQQAAVYIDLLANKTPHLKILEIGSGTGGATIPVLDVLGGKEDGSFPRFMCYDATDITTGFFPIIQEKANAWKTLMNFRKLDIESDPIEQGFEAESYDLIIAANVLHATHSMTVTMAHVRKLLKPGGSLILIELMPKTGGVASLFGIFPGWWSGEEEHRRSCPLLTEPQWHTIMKETGFTGIEVSLWDTQDSITHQGTTMITKAATPSSLDLPKATIIVDQREPMPPLENLYESLKSQGIRTDTTDMEHIASDDSIFIVLELSGNSLLKDLNMTTFEALKNMLCKSKGVLWITQGATVGSAIPDQNLVQGLMRTLRVELNSSLIHLDLDHNGESFSHRTCDLIAQVYKKSFSPLASTDIESELAEREHTLIIPRHVGELEMSLFVAGRTNTTVPVSQLVVQPKRPLKLEIGAVGLLDSAYFIDDERVEGILPADYVEIEIKAAALNFKDVMVVSSHLFVFIFEEANNSQQSMGQISPYPLGDECSGVISSVGKDVKNFNIGDRVATVAPGSFSTLVRRPSLGVEKIPDGMTFEEATTLPIVFCTAMHSARVAKLQKGDTALIHAASGGLGQALIHVCKYFGVEVYATVGSKLKKTFLMETFAIPEDHIFYSRDDGFAHDILRETNKRGVDVIFNSLSSELLRRTWQCIAPFGRFIELGKRDFAVNSRLDMAQFAQNVTFSAVDILQVLYEMPEYGAQLWHDALSLITNGHAKPPMPISVYSMADVENAMRTMQTGRHIGKIVLVPDSTNLAKVSESDIRALQSEDCLSYAGNAHKVTQNHTLCRRDIPTHRRTRWNRTNFRCRNGRIWCQEYCIHLPQRSLKRKCYIYHQAAEFEGSHRPGTGLRCERLSGTASSVG